MTKRYLLEIGMEEFPARYVKGTKKQFNDAIANSLTEAKISFEKIVIKSTPRRFAIYIDGLDEKSKSSVVEVKGPTKKISYDEAGNISKALLGFLRGQNATEEDTFIKELKGVEYVYINKKTEGIEVEEFLAKTIPEIIKNISFPKSMHWGGKNIKFARPIRWLISLLDEKVLEFDLEGIPVGNITYGHRYLSEGPISISNIDEYEIKLEENYVIVDELKREEVIREKSLELVDEFGGYLNFDEDLLDEIVHILEYPTPLIGNIKKEYLELPKEVIVTPMQDHQRYFPVLSKDGSLLPYFITVRNGNDYSIDTVRKGNEKVLAPRLEDAKFFYNEDLKNSLDSYVEKLKRVVFHVKLGTVYDKTKRLEKLTAKIAEKFGVENEVSVDVQRAAYLAKADLVTNMVMEFTELEGTMGRIYALKSGENDNVAYAIEEQYYPKSSGSAIPEKMTGKILSIADKLDTICGMMMAGIKTTGSQDPFGLRRSAIGILRILIESNIDANLEELIDITMDIYLETISFEIDREKVKLEIIDFLMGRLKSMFESKDYKYDVIDAVMSVESSNILDIQNRMDFIEALKNSGELENIMAVIRRMISFIEKGDFTNIDEALITTEEEKQIFAFENIKNEVDGYILDRDYKKILDLLTTMLIPMSNYLDNTMILVEDQKLKENRIALINNVYKRFLYIFNPLKITKA